MATRQEKSEYQRNWRACNRSTWIEKNGPCVRCGSWDQLEVDHIDPHQKVDHRIWSWSAERRGAELAKCQVLCHDCHLTKTHGPNRPHGVRTTGRSSGHPGESHPFTKLRNADVITIRNQYAAGAKITALAREFGVGTSTIFKIVHNQTWRHVQ